MKGSRRQSQTPREGPSAGGLGCGRHLGLPLRGRAACVPSTGGSREAEVTEASGFLALSLHQKEVLGNFNVLGTREALGSDPGAGSPGPSSLFCKHDRPGHGTLGHVLLGYSASGR